MKANEYQKLAQRTECDMNAARSRMDNKAAITINHSIIGILGEGGELANLLQKWVYYGKVFPNDELRVKLAEEYGDVLWYVAEGLNALGVSMEDVMKANIEKLKVRYPDKYTDYNAAEENRDLSKEYETLKKVNDSLPKKS